MIQGGDFSCYFFFFGKYEEKRVSISDIYTL